MYFQESQKLISDLSSKREILKSEAMQKQELQFKRYNTFKKVMHNVMRHNRKCWDLFKDRLTIYSIVCWMMFLKRPVNFEHCSKWVSGSLNWQFDSWYSLRPAWVQGLSCNFGKSTRQKTCFPWSHQLSELQDCLPRRRVLLLLMHYIYRLLFKPSTESQSIPALSNLAFTSVWSSLTASLHSL